MTAPIEGPRYPLDRLIEKMGVTADEARRQLGIGGSRVGTLMQHGLTLEQAERFADRARLHPFEVWPEMRTVVLAEVERVCADDRCDVVFVAENPRRIYCSRICRDRRTKREWARRKYRDDAEFRRREAERTARYHAEVVVPARERRRVRAAS